MPEPVDRLAALKDIPSVVNFIRNDILMELEPESDDFWKLVDVIYALKCINNDFQKRRKLKLGKKCRIVAKESASERTNEFINQHNQPFVIYRKDLMANQIMFRSDDEYYGWLSLDEIIIEDYV